MIGLALTLVLAAAPAPPDADLARGVKLVEQGEYAQAILLLDTTAQRLDKKGAKADAARAYLYLGMAYVGENQETLALSSFQRALDRDEKIELSAFDVSPKVREAFEKARRERHQEKLASQKKGGSKAPLFILGGLAVAGGGVAVAVAGKGGGDGSSNAPTEATVFPAYAGGCDGNSASSDTKDFPPPGSTVKLSEGRTASVTYQFTLPCTRQGVSLEVALADASNHGCFYGQSAPFDTQAGLPMTNIVVPIALTAANARCTAPFVVDTIQWRARDSAGTSLTVPLVQHGSGFQVVP